MILDFILHSSNSLSNNVGFLPQLSIITFESSNSSFVSIKLLSKFLLLSRVACEVLDELSQFFFFLLEIILVSFVVLFVYFVKCFLNLRVD